MSVASHTIIDRVEQAYVELTPIQVALAVTLIIALSSVLLFMQEPMVHEVMHNFRHAAGITCH